MISKFINSYRVIINNFLSLSFLNFINYLVPVLVMPYLISTLGLEKFGLLMFSQSVVGYFMLMSSYGFNLSATKDISLNRNNDDIVSTIFCSVTLIKFLFASLFFIIFIFLILFVNKFNTNFWLYFFNYLVIFSNVFIPQWLFQGLEKMKYLTYINAASKILFAISILFFIKKPDDFLLYPLLTFATSSIAGIISIYLSVKIVKIKFQIPSYTYLKKSLENGFHLFISTFFMNFYRDTNTIILGFLTNDIFVGYYSSAEKLIKVIQSLIAPVSDALFPHLSNKFSLNSISKNIEFMFKLSRYYLYSLIGISIIVVVFSDFVVNIMFGDYDNIKRNVTILSFAILPGGLNYYFGVLGLVNIGKQNCLSKNIIITGLLSIATCFSLSILFKDLGAAFTMVISEYILLVLILFELRIAKRNLNVL